MKKDSITTPNIDELAVAALSEQGYLFRQQVLEEIKNNGEKEGWYLEDEEHPISAGEHETIIDFVLGCSSIKNHSFVFECKRAQRDYISWVFADTLIYREDRKFRLPAILCNVVPGEPKTRASRQETSAITLPFCETDPSYCVDVGLEVHYQKRQGRLSQSKTIFEACNQVMTGVAGLVAYRLEKLKHSPIDGRWCYIPVIVTTAKLYLTKYDAREVSLEAGTIELSKTKTQEVPWVYYDFPTRPSLPLTPIPYDFQPKGLRELRELKQEFKIKSVIIVTSTNLLNLLRQLRASLGF